MVVTLVLGSAVACGGGGRGQLRAIVLDPAAGTATHLVVEPEGRMGLARLVPLDLVEVTREDVTGGEVRLRCTEAEFRDLAAAEETLAEFVPGYQVPVQLLPDGWRDAGGPAAQGAAIPRILEKETIDVMPPGEAEEGQGARVHATDGDVGQVRALRIDPASRQLTHVLVREGHWLARKDVAIPFSSVVGFEDGIRLSLTRQQVRDLPAADGDPCAG
jgi:sporulation protein YlmC with PRC-barrel domain